jgi:hypothetical protein
MKPASARLHPLESRCSGVQGGAQQRSARRVAEDSRRFMETALCGGLDASRETSGHVIVPVGCLGRVKSLYGHPPPARHKDRALMFRRATAIVSQRYRAAFRCAFHTGYSKCR